MRGPLVSVIIPAHNGGELLAQAIRSVLEQTHTRFELIVVDDASTDDTPEVLSRFEDPRLKCIAQPENRGPGAARLIGLEASTGEIVAFLDQDDLFHPDKLQAHVAFLARHPETGLTYNAHFTLSHPAGVITGIWRPPATITLADIVLGFPIGPSVWVLRREWAVRDELWNDDAMLRGAEAVFCGRLLLAGCRFSLVDRALNYRRIHIGRRFTDPARKCGDERRCQDVVFNDARCPVEVRSLRDAAFVNNYLVWANVALAQRETEVGRALLREALRLDPGLVAGRPSTLAEFLLSHAVREAPDAEEQLRSIFDQLPNELSQSRTEVDWAVCQAHLVQGSQHALWGRPGHAESHFSRAAQLGAKIDDAFLQRLSYELLSYELEFGRRDTGEAIDRLGAALSEVGGTSSGRRLKGTYHLGRAFHLYALGERRTVPTSVLRGLIGDPRALANRGAWSVLLRTASPRWLST